MNTHELAKRLLDLPKCKVVASIDLSTENSDSGRKVFGELYDVQYETTRKTITLLFDAGFTNDEA